MNICAKTREAEAGRSEFEDSLNYITRLPQKSTIDTERDGSAVKRTGLFSTTFVEAHNGLIPVPVSIFCPPQALHVGSA